MNNTFRTVIGLSFVFPIVILERVMSLITGRERSIRVTGALLSRISAGALSLIVPSVSSAGEFDSFRGKIKRNFRRWNIVYDTALVEDSPGRVKFNVLNCPFTDALKAMGEKELCKYACAGDWLVAAKNRGNWDFAKAHSLGTDGCPCDHTYTRKER